MEGDFVHTYLNVHVRYVSRKKKNMGGCRIWLSNIIVEEVIEVDELDEGNTSAAAEK